VARDGQRPERSGDDVNDNPSCCTPQFSTSQSAGSRVPVRPDRGSYSIEQCSIRAGVFAMGDAQGDGKRGDGEGPVLNVELDAFTIDATSVTNAAFVNTGEDGWITTTAVRSYSPNAFGLWQTGGNVWEWCQDVLNPRAYAARAGTQPVHDPKQLAANGPRVLRGGSYLCHDSYCNRYRSAARSSNTPDSVGRAGFRTVAR
jgi:formylglycine-generating enzyme required for sulfatase activity